MAQISDSQALELLKLSESLQHAVKQIALGQQGPKEQQASFSVLQQNVLEHATKIQQVLITPGQLLTQQQINSQHLASLRWIAHFDLPKRVPVSPADASISYEALAKEAGVPLTQLRSICRMAMTLGFFAEPQPGKLGHSRISRAFAEDSTLVDWTIVAAESTALHASKFVEATEKYGDTQDKTKTAFNIGRQTDQPFFDYLKTNERLRKQFASFMKNITNTDATTMDHVVDGFNWASLPEGSTVVDLGGSTGHAAIAVAQQHKHVKFVIQDLPDTIQTSATDLSTLPADIASRISFQGHDFFTPEPLKGAAAYFMRTIIHDWPFDEATKILGHLADAMGPDSRLLIMDIVLPQPGTTSLLDEQLSRLRDLTMIETFNAKERELQEWDDLVKAVGKDLRIANVVTPPGSSLSVIEVVRGGASGQVNGVNGH